MPVLELAVQDAEGARIARAVGASRVELCAALGPTGGLTPSIGTIESVVNEEVPTHVLVRPRAGGFVYTREEMRLAVNDIGAALDADADGVVIGALDESGAIDLVVLEHFVRAARWKTVTFHRAFDVVLAGGADPAAALATLRDAGVHRVLTSGGAATCGEGLTTLRALAAASSGVEITAGGGVRVEDVPALIDAGVDAVHLSARAVVADAPSGPGGGPSTREVTDPVLAQAVAAALA